MPEPTFLQIHGPDNAAMRMIELPGGPVRIGRGTHCEIRLGCPALGEVQCVLRRRGTTWHLQPVGPLGLVWINGQPVDHQRSLQLGVPFRVGEDWLTIRPADSAINDWGSFDEPIIVEPHALDDDEPKTVESVEVIAHAESIDSADPESSRIKPASTTEENEERLRRWQARLEQRERFLKDRQDEKRWEARWKSAGESIRARSTSSSTPAPSAPRSAPPPVAPSRPASRPTHTPPVARIIEPRPSESLKRVAEPPRVEPPRVPVRPVNGGADETGRKTIETPRVRVVVSKTLGREISTSPIPIPRPFSAPASTSKTRSVVTPSPTRVDWSNARKVTAKEVTSVPASTPPPGTAEAPIREVEFPDLPTGPIAEVVAGIEVASESAALCFVGAVPDPVEKVEPIKDEFPTATCESAVEDQPASIEPEVDVVSSARSLIESSTWLSELPETSGETAWDDGKVSSPLTPASDSTSAWPEPAYRSAEADPVLTKAAWPSAKAIFASQGSRSQTSREPSGSSRRRSAEPVPTDLLGPAQWTMPLWLGWFPVLVVTMLLGVVGLALSYEWMIEANQANVALKLALRPEGSPGSSIDLSAIPRGGWWLSNATHLSAWAVAIERLENGQDHADEIRSLVDAARNASQLSARSRFLVEATESPNRPDSAGDLSSVGRTRDVLTLAGTGRRLRNAGKLDSSFRAYHAAMELAARAERATLDPPTFDEGPQARRYALPREALLRLVALDMVAAGGWTSEQWAEVLPPTATASIVAARVLADSQNRTEADRLAELAIRQAETNPPPGYDPAEHRAAGAEALAYRGRWTDSAEQYRLAIDQADDDATRRMWWLNLAEIAQRVGDDAGRLRAIEAAKSTDSIDEITKRALKYQQGLSSLATSNPRR